MDSIRNAKKSLKAAKEREKTVIIGDMKPLETALPLISDTTSSTKPTRYCDVTYRYLIKCTLVQ